jgi:hypothetical protein
MRKPAPDFGALHRNFSATINSDPKSIINNLEPIRKIDTSNTQKRIITIYHQL